MTAVAVIPIAVREALSSSYEDLRRVALSGASAAVGVGFALFIRSGMARWMDTCADLLARPVVALPPQRHVEDQVQLAPDLRVEVARVLAQMALSAHTPGVTKC